MIHSRRLAISFSKNVDALSIVAKLELADEAMEGSLILIFGFPDLHKIPYYVI